RVVTGRIGPGINGRPNPDVCINRDDIILKIDIEFGFSNLIENPTGNKRICILLGEGGSGKTFIATKYAFHRTIYDTVSWFKADSKKNSEDSFFEFAKWLTQKSELDLRALAQETVFELVNSELKDKSTFIVLDNVEVYEDIRWIIQGLSTARFIITTRNKLVNGIDVLDSISVSFPDTKSGIKFVLDSIGESNIQHDEAKILVKICDNIPLRLGVAVAYLKTCTRGKIGEHHKIGSHGIAMLFGNVTEKIQEYEVEFRQILDRFENQIQAAKKHCHPESHPEIVICLNTLKEKHPESFDCILLCSELDPDQERGLLDIFFPSKNTLSDESLFEPLFDLGLVCLLDPDEKNYLFSIHRCIISQLKKTVKDIGISSRAASVKNFFSSEIDEKRKATIFTDLGSNELFQKAMNRFIQAADFENPESYFWLFFQYKFGLPVTSESIILDSYFQKALNFGVDCTCVDFLSLHSDDCVQPRFDESVKKLIFNSNADINSDMIPFLAKSLISNSSIIEANLNMCKILNDGALVICNNPTLRILSLNGNKIGDKGAKAVSKCLNLNTVIQKLQLDSNEIQDEGIMNISESLCSNKTLKILDLRGNKFGIEGLKSLARAVETNHTLEELDISGNNFEGEKIKLILNSLGKNSTLRSFRVVGCRIGIDGADAISDFLKSGNKSLRKLEISSNTLLDEGIMKITDSLGKNKSILEIDLGYNDLTSHGVTKIADSLTKNNTLKSLILTKNHIGFDGIEYLSKPLVSSNTLQSLFIGYNFIGYKGMEVLAKVLELNTSLQILHVDGNQLNDEGAKFIGAAIKINTSLKSLSICKNGIGKIGAISIAESLKYNSTLTTLNLDGNKIQNEGAEEFANVLETNTSLQTLDLTMNRIGEHGANAIGRSLEKNTTLKNLILKNNKIGSGILSIAKSLVINKTLLQLNVSRNEIDKEIEIKCLEDYGFEMSGH
ncbi:hypothetical protein HK096_003476, partial [Nowakowskiella sp. JEL0078]